MPADPELQGCITSMGCIVIPACNEGATIGRLLNELVEHNVPPMFEILVVCNGCSDNTFAVASSFGGNIRAIDLAEGGKTNALNVADKKVTSFPRIYLDADIRITKESLQNLANALIDTSSMAASATPIFHYSQSTWLVRQYFSARKKLPFVTKGQSIAGCGVYALSELGHNRLGSFPDVLNDDGYVNRLFEDHEKQKPADCFARISAPKNWPTLCRIRARSYMGNRELNGLQLPGKSTTKNQVNSLKTMLFSSLWLAAVVYSGTQIAVRVYALIISPIIGRAGHWERDESTRT